MKRWVSLLVGLAVAAAAASAALVVSGRLSSLHAVLATPAIPYVAVALVGAAILRSQPRNAVGWLFLVSGVSLPVATVLAATAQAQAAQHPAAAAWIDTAAQPLEVAAVPLIATFGILLFPGRPLATRPRRILAAVYAVELLYLCAWATLSPQVTDVPTLVNPIGVTGVDSAGIPSILLLGPLSLFACVSLLRYARRDTGPYAPALRAAGWTSFVVAAAYLACVVTGFSGGDTEQISLAENVAVITLAVAAWVGIARHGLFDTRAVLSRTLIYASLSAVIVVVYLLATVLTNLLFRGLVPQIVAAVVAALTVLPLREFAQRRVNQMVYGLRDDPAAAFARLGDRLDAAGAPDDLLPAATRTLSEVLRLPYVAIEVDGEIVDQHGRRLPGTVTALPLPFAGETIGHLVVQIRSDGDLAADELRLLTGLTRQVAVAARAVALTRALQQSRQRLVSLREDERRRLRRDLHDGLGPTLAGIALGIDTARRAVPAGGATADLLGSLRHETEAAVADIRRIVYELRPPILDELGLAGAVREQAVRLCSAAVTVAADLPVLPAAVEVAAYRIVMEALTNAARHAPGSAVSVRLAVNGHLELSVADEGAGLPDDFQAGVGLHSMRERAAELGGVCDISRRRPRGTLVRAEIPVPEPS
jgi:signal transduction histidine kinase